MMNAERVDALHCLAHEEKSKKEKTVVLMNIEQGTRNDEC